VNNAIRAVISWQQSISRSVEDDQESDQTVPIAAEKSAFVEAVKYGSLGGLVATVSMTVFRMPTSKSLPPTARFWAKFVGSGEPEEYTATALLLHLLYGVGGGVFFALLTPGRNDAEEIAETKGAILGTIYGMALSIFGVRVILEGLLGTDPDTDERLIFHISHVVYGLTLGTWVGSRFGTAHEDRNVSRGTR